jgi:MoaA/NifB/PqqE/SkfB family radical SAM enzyme
MNFYYSMIIRKKIHYFLTEINKSLNRMIFYSRSKNKKTSYIKYNQNRNQGPQKQICFAPQKSMYFNISGKVIACCLNKSHIFGTFPANTIREIWEGQQIKKLRTALKKSDLSLGCSFCKYSIESGNFDTVQASRYDDIPLSQKYPTMLEFALDNRCNLKCIMCSDEYSSAFLSESDTRKDIKIYNDDFVTQLEEFIPHLVHTSFYGGEPFLSPIYYKIWERIIEINPKCFISVQTNATVFNERIRNIIERGNFIINVSLDSFNKTTYENIRVNADFEEVIKNLNYLLQYASEKKYTIGISVCPMNQNWKELPEIVKKCNEINATVYFNTVWLPVKCSLYYRPPNDLRLIYEKLSAIPLTENSPIEKKNKYHFECFLLQLLKWEQDKILEEAIWKEQKIDKNDWQNIPLSELIVLLIKKMKLQLTENKNVPIEEIAQPIDKLITVLKKFEDSVSYREALLRLIEIPADLLSYEILFKDADTLEEQIEGFICQVNS